jgi:cell division protein FtsZ
MGVLVHFKMHPDFPMMELSEAMDVVHESAHEEAEVIFGTSTDDDLPVDFVRITLVATGFERALGDIANNDSFENVEQPKPRAIIRPQLVVNGDMSEDFLDVPTYMRQQKD